MKGEKAWRIPPNACRRQGAFMNAIEPNAVARDGRVTVTIPDACTPELEALFHERC
jgi:hypothetical protein